LKRAEPKAAGGRVFQPFDRLAALAAGVDQLFGQRAHDSVLAGVDLCGCASVSAAVSMTPHAEALITEVTPPDWA